MESNQPNYIRISFKDNPELKDVFREKESGGKCTFTVTMQLNTKTDEEARGTIEKIEYEKGEVEPDTEKPVALLLIASESKNKSDAAKEYAEST